MMPWCKVVTIKVGILVMITATITIKMTLTQATSQCQKVPWSLHCWGRNWHRQVGLWISACLFFLTWHFSDKRTDCWAKLNESFWRPKITLINVNQISLNVRKGREVAVACWRGEHQLQVFWKQYESDFPRGPARYFEFFFLITTWSLIITKYETDYVRGPARYCGLFVLTTIW